MTENYEKDFVPYEQALALKELGFDEPCMCFYNNRKELKVYHNVDKDWDTLEHQLLGNSKITLPNTYSAPTFSQAFRWFREKYGLDVTFRKMDYGPESQFTGYYFSIYKGNELIDIHGADKKGKLYEDSELECLKKLIEIVKQQTHATTN
jgi:hypothetical protein